MTGDRAIRIGMVGSGFMAQQHSAAYHLLPVVHGSAVPRVELKRIAGGSRVQSAARHYGWREAADDWRAVTEADDIDVVDIVTPNDTHARLTISAARHGKQVICEKPLARDYAEALAMQEAVRAAGVRATVCFVYRTWPATQVAKDIVDSGRLGRVHGYRGHFLHDHFVAHEPTAWRFDPARAGSGVIGDIGSHALDLARHLVGDVAEVFTTSRTVLPAGPVPIDDEADVLLRFADGATGHLWLSWLATGTPMDVGFHVMGDRGALRFSWTRPAELAVYDASDPEGARGYTTIPLGPDHPPAAPYLPLAGAGIGYQESFVELLALFLGGSDTGPAFDDGVTINGYLDATLRSARTQRWEPVSGP